MNDIILASASPRRKELLKLITNDFIVIAANCDETVPSNIEAVDSPEYLAIVKALEIARLYPDDIVIGADTSVIINNEILGKPKDEQEAYLMLKKLSGETHLVVTGCAIVFKEKVYSFSSKTEVDFYSLSDKEIYGYIKSGEPFDKAGGYGIQSQGSLFVKKINGDYFNVVGLPIARLKRKLEKIVK